MDYFRVMCVTMTVFCICVFVFKGKLYFIHGAIAWEVLFPSNSEAGFGNVLTWHWRKYSKLNIMTRSHIQTINAVLVLFDVVRQIRSNGSEECKWTRSSLPLSRFPLLVLTWNKYEWTSHVITQLMFQSQNESRRQLVNKMPRSISVPSGKSLESTTHY